MIVTIELKPETEKRLAEKAKQNGLPIETFIEVFIEDNLDEEIETATEEKPFHEETEEWITKLKRWSESHDRTTPFLSDEATRRENIY